MNIILINSSPRKQGNSYFASKAIYEKLSTDNNVEMIDLNFISYKGCQGCLSCRKNNSFCVVQDDINKILSSIPSMDLIIMISPNYYGTINGQMKMFIDRWYCLKDSNKISKMKENAKLFFILTQGAPNRDHGKSSVEWFKHIAESFKMKYYGYIVPNCSPDNLDGVKLKMSEMLMHINMFI